MIDLPVGSWLNRYVCTKEAPWSEDKGFGVHPDAVLISVDKSQCPNCNFTFGSPVLRPLQVPLYKSEQEGLKPPARKYKGRFEMIFFQRPFGAKCQIRIFFKRSRREKRDWIRQRRAWMQGPRREQKTRAAC